MKRTASLASFIFIAAIVVVLSASPARAHVGEEEEIYAPIPQPPMPPAPTFPINTPRPTLGYIFTGAGAAGAGLVIWQLFKKKR